MQICSQRVVVCNAHPASRTICGLIVKFLLKVPLGKESIRTKLQQRFDLHSFSDRWKLRRHRNERAMRSPRTYNHCTASPRSRGSNGNSCGVPQSPFVTFPQPSSIVEAGFAVHPRKSLNIYGKNWVQLP